MTAQMEMPQPILLLPEYGDLTALCHEAIDRPTIVKMFWVLAED